MRVLVGVISLVAGSLIAVGPSAGATTLVHKTARVKAVAVAVHAVDMASAAGIYEVTRSRMGSAYDYDEDGCTDLIVNRKQPNPPELYHNNCNGTFSLEPNVFPTGDHHDAAWGDFNGDGLPDLYWTVGGDSGHGALDKQLWIQQPNHTFVNEAVKYGVQDPYGRGRAVTVLDVNNDGRPDLYVGNKTPRLDGIPDPNRLWINTGKDSFRDAPEMGLDFEEDVLSAQTADVNHDGFPDVFMQGGRQSAIFRNNAGASFTDVSRAMDLPTGPSVDAQLVDLDGDGFPDLIWMTSSGLQIWLQRDGAFSDLVYSQRLKSPAGFAVGDVNGDGAADIYVLEADNAKYLTDPDFVLINNGAGTAFSTLAVPQATFGVGDAVWPIDYDNNGLTDFVVTNGATKAGPVELIAFFPDGAAPTAARVRAPRMRITPGAPTPPRAEGKSESGAPADAAPPALVSVNPAAVAGDGDSIRSSVSDNGRYVAFDSWASDLVGSDDNLCADIFVRDTVTDSTQLVSVSSSGGSADKGSGAPRITPDGRYVVFYSYASNLVTGVANGVSHIFERDLDSGTTRVVDTAADGTLADAESGSPSVSADGRYVAFESDADNLLPGDHTHHIQVFVKDLQTGAVMLVSADPSGGFGNGDSIQPDITPDGSYVAFASQASDLIAGDSDRGYDVFLRDMQLGTTVLVSVSRTGSQHAAALEPSVSADGRYVSFSSDSRTLVADPVATHLDSNIFIRDVVAGTTVQASVASDGTDPNGSSFSSHLSADGTSVVFTSTASNLVPGDSGKTEDVFARDLVGGVTTKVSTTAAAGPLLVDAYASSASPDNRFVSWTSATTAIGANPSKASQLYERDTGAPSGAPRAAVDAEQQSAR